MYVYDTYIFAIYVMYIYVHTRTHAHTRMHACFVGRFVCVLYISSSLRKVIKMVLLTYIKSGTSPYQGHFVNEREKSKSWLGGQSSQHIQLSAPSPEPRLWTLLCGPTGLHQTFTFVQFLNVQEQCQRFMTCNQLCRCLGGH